MADAIKLHVWDGVKWTPAVGNDGPPGPSGPAGPEGQGIEVFGPQLAVPTATRKGDHWLEVAARDAGANVVPSPITLEPLTVRLLPDPVPPVFVRYLP